MPLSGKELVKLLQSEGWALIRINGNHHILKKDGKITVVPVHGNQSLGKGIEAKILKQAGLKKMNYYAKIKKQKDGKYLVEFPELPGCFTEGNNKERALKNAKEALDGWLAASCDHNLDIHSPIKRNGTSFYLIEVDMNIGFAVSLRLARAKLGLTQAAAAKKMHMSQQAYSKLESPKTTNPSLSTLKKIAQCLELEIELKLAS